MSTPGVWCMKSHKRSKTALRMEFSVMMMSEQKPTARLTYVNSPFFVNVCLPLSSLPPSLYLTLNSISLFCFQAAN